MILTSCLALSLEASYRIGVWYVEANSAGCVCLEESGPTSYRSSKEKVIDTHCLSLFWMIVPVSRIVSHLSSFLSTVFGNLPCGRAWILWKFTWIHQLSEVSSLLTYKKLIWSYLTRDPWCLWGTNGTPALVEPAVSISWRPTPVVDYGWCLYPNQLSGEIEYGVPGMMCQNP